MKKGSALWVVIILIVIIGAIAFAMSRPNNVEDAMMDDSMMMEDDHMHDGSEDDDHMHDDEMMEKDDSMVMEDEGDAMMKGPGSYEDYSPEKLAKANEGDLVIFFHANWCPTCRSLESNIKEELANIPEGVTILKADYDRETELKKKYGITFQHSLVQVDAEGNLISKWTGSPTLASIVSRIQ